MECISSITFNKYNLEGARENKGRYGGKPKAYFQLAVIFLMPYGKKYCCLFTEDGEPSLK